jgi:hypothetical protein
VNVSYAGAKCAADCINLRFDPNRIDHDTTFIREILNFLGKRIRNPLPARPPIQGFSGALKRTPLTLHLSNGLDQLSCLKPMETIFDF